MLCAPCAAIRGYSNHVEGRSQRLESLLAKALETGDTEEERYTALGQWVKLCREIDRDPDEGVAFLLRKLLNGTAEDKALCFGVMAEDAVRRGAEVEIIRFAG